MQGGIRRKRDLLPRHQNNGNAASKSKTWLTTPMKKIIGYFILLFVLFVMISVAFSDNDTIDLRAELDNTVKIVMDMYNKNYNSKIEPIVEEEKPKKEDTSMPKPPTEGKNMVGKDMVDGDLINNKGAQEQAALPAQQQQQAAPPAQQQQQAAPPAQQQQQAAPPAQQQQQAAPPAQQQQQAAPPAQQQQQAAPPAQQQQQAAPPAQQQQQAPGQGVPNDLLNN